MTPLETEMPLGISEAYDLLPPTGAAWDLRCQDCDQIFVDRARKISVGAHVLAVFCPACRSCRRQRFAVPLPAAHVLLSTRTETSWSDAWGRILQIMRRSLSNRRLSSKDAS
jgi:hypothetical protein